MGNEDPLFVIGLGVVALLLIAIALFIPLKFVQLFIRDLRARQRFLKAPSGMSDEGQVVDAVQSADSRKRWRLLRRPHGLYLYEELTLEDEIRYEDEDGKEGEIAVEARWSRT